MRKLLFIFAILSATKLFAGGGPSLCPGTGNDFCFTAIKLTLNDPCVDGCTNGAGVEVGELGACATGNKTIWYRFIASATSHQVNVYYDASDGCYFASNVWEGTCLPSINISCHDATNGPLNQAHLLTGLTIGNIYMVQVIYDAGGSCGANADVCVELITYNPCNICGNECYAVCEWITPPTVAQVLSTCPSSNYSPALHGVAKKECWTFTANSTKVIFSAIISSDCGGGQFSFLEWELFDGGCTSVVGPTNIFSSNTATTIPGQNYTLCFDMVFAECNISIIYPYVIVGEAPLPITLLYFNAGYNGEDANLSWATASETNNDYFTIENSVDGQNFTPLFTVPGAGNSNEMRLYYSKDQYPLPGISYYRLKQTDYDGQYQYSDLVSIKVEIENFNQTYQIFDISGKLVNHQKFSGIPQGVYYIFNGKTYYKMFKMD